MLTPLEVAKVTKFLGYPLTSGADDPAGGYGVINQFQSSVPSACASLIPHAADLIREYIKRLECIEAQQQAAYSNQQVVVAGRTTMSGPQAIMALRVAYQHEQAKLSDALRVPVYSGSSYAGSNHIHEPC